MTVVNANMTTAALMSFPAIPPKTDENAVVTSSEPLTSSITTPEISPPCPTPVIFMMFAQVIPPLFTGALNVPPSAVRNSRSSPPPETKSSAPGVTSPSCSVSRKYCGCAVMF